VGLLRTIVILELGDLLRRIANDAVFSPADYELVAKNVEV